MLESSCDESLSVSEAELSKQLQETSVDDIPLLAPRPRAMSFDLDDDPSAFDPIHDDTIGVPLHPSSIQDSFPLHISPKRIVDEVYLPEINPPNPDRKRRKTVTEQQIKRHKYDVLKAFFRVYFTVDEKSAVLKDAIYNLYTQKIATESQIARNAMYRHMWSFFKNKNISSSQSNYRDYVKGIKLLTNQSELYYEGYERDLETLRNNGVSHDLFGFDEADLASLKKEEESPEMISVPALPPPSSKPFAIPELTNQGELISYIEQLEQTALGLASALGELKQRLKDGSLQA